MTTPKPNGGKLAWLIIAGLIGAFGTVGAGVVGYVQSGNTTAHGTLAQQIDDCEVVDADHSARLSTAEANYEHVHEQLDEIKADVRLILERLP